MDTLEPMARRALRRKESPRPRNWATRSTRRESRARNLRVQRVTLGTRPQRAEGAREQDKPMNIQTMRVRGQELRVAVKAGAPERPPLLLFNGIGANLELALPFMREMGDVGTVIFDIPGVGGSPLPRLPYRPSTVAKWGLEVMRQLGHQSFDVAGVSWGGAMAQQIAHQFPGTCGG